jgi:hypothetical protein
MELLSATRLEAVKCFEKMVFSIFIDKEATPLHTASIP